MSKLYFYFSAMNAGKTTALLQSAYNYQERGMKILLYTAELVCQKNNTKYIRSRIGLTSSAKIFNDQTDLFKQISIEHQEKKIYCVLIDECHFLNRKQVTDLTRVVDILNVPVLCYGLRTDFRSELFSGSLWLLAWADKLIELKTICYCGRQANRTLRIDNNGYVVTEGDQIMFGGNNQYVSVCRRHFYEKIQAKYC